MISDDLDEPREELVDGRPFPGVRSSESSSGLRLEREPVDQDLEAPERDRLFAPHELAEVGGVEAGEVGLEVAPVSEDRGPEALYSGTVTS